MPISSFKTLSSWILLLSLLVILLMVNLSLGSVSIPLSEILSIILQRESTNEVWSNIVWDFRITKASTCILAGGALSIGGLQMQTLFRNALAGPDVLGLSSGASLAVSVVFMGHVAGIHFLNSPSSWSIVIASSLGAFVVFILIWSLSQRLRDNTSLLIVGIMIGAATSSMVSVLQFLSKPEEQQSFLLWTFGSLGGLNWTEIQILTGILILGSVIGILSTKALNAWALGDNYSMSLGINLKRSRFLIIFSTSILTGAVTAFCGPIAFVGLAVPHLTKLLIKTNNHRILIPAVVIMGASLFLFCDIIAQLPGSMYILPINAITALVGAPVVIWIILRAKRLAI
jgi:iron complex transport system permease protein